MLYRELEQTAAHRTRAFKNNRANKNRDVASKNRDDGKEELPSPVATYASIHAPTSAAGKLAEGEMVDEINRRNQRNSKCKGNGFL